MLVWSATVCQVLYRAWKSVVSKVGEILTLGCFCLAGKLEAKQQIQWVKCQGRTV